MRVVFEISENRPYGSSLVEMTLFRNLYLVTSGRHANRAEAKSLFTSPRNKSALLHRWNAGLRWTPPALDTKSENVGVDQQNEILIEKLPNGYVACAWPGLPVPLTSSVRRAWCLQQIHVRKHTSQH